MYFFLIPLRHKFKERHKEWEVSILKVGIHRSNPVATSRKRVNQTDYRIRQLSQTATIGSIKTIATATIRFVVTVALLYRKAQHL